MIEPGLCDRIVRGEQIDVIIVSDDEKKIDEFLLLLKQFNQRHCNGHSVLGCNRFILQRGHKIEVTVESMPDGPRQLLAGTLMDVGKPINSPFNITARVKRS